MIVKRNKGNVRVIGSTTFYPGANFLSEGQTEEMKEHPSFQKELKMHLGEGKMVMEIIGEENAPSLYDAVAQLSNSKAIKVVKETYNIKDLRDSLKKEKRSAVTRAIEDQIKILTGDREKENDKS